MRLADSPVAALAVPRFAAYWAAQTVSVVASYGFWTGLAIQLAAIEHRPGLLAAVRSANAACQIAFMLVGGAAADRFGARRGVIAGDALRAVAAAAFAVLYHAGGATAAVYVGMSVLVGCGDAVFLPAYGAVGTDLVPESALASANSVRLAGHIAAATLGPLLAGVAGAADALGLLFAAEASTFLLGALVAAAVVRAAVARAEATPEPSSFLREIGPGLRYALATPFVLRGVIFAALVTLAVDGPAVVLLPVHAASPTGLALGVAGFGWLSATRGAGALVGAAWWGRGAAAARGRARPLAVCYLLWGAGLVACGQTVAALAFAGIAVAGFAIAGEEIVWYTALQKTTPRELLGRTLAFGDAVMLLPQPASYALAALTVGLIAPGRVIALAGLATAAVGFLVLGGALPEPVEPG
jgi:hypothetical protein